MTDLFDTPVPAAQPVHAPSCPACDAAQTSTKGGQTRGDCEGCRIRMLADSPKVIRLAAYTRLKDQKDRDALKAAVENEYIRLQALRKEGK